MISLGQKRPDLYSGDQVVAWFDKLGQNKVQRTDVERRIGFRCRREDVRAIHGQRFERVSCAACGAVAEVDIRRCHGVTDPNRSGGSSRIDRIVFRARIRGRGQRAVSERTGLREQHRQAAICHSRSDRKARHRRIGP